MRFLDEKPPTICKFQGKVFTEKVQHGRTPITAKHFPDIVFLGTGTSEDCTYE
jgi:hypothetical protein